MTDETKTTEDRSWRPYLIRAIHEWLGDIGQTPHILVDASAPDVVVPREHVKDDRIVLNIAFTATQRLELGNDFVDFMARFGGREQAVHIPVTAVLGIYSRETGQGMVFAGDESDAPPPADGGPADGSDGASQRPRLRVVK